MSLSGIGSSFHGHLIFVDGAFNPPAAPGNKRIYDLFYLALLEGLMGLSLDIFS